MLLSSSSHQAVVVTSDLVFVSVSKWIFQCQSVKEPAKLMWFQQNLRHKFIVQNENYIIIIQYQNSTSKSRIKSILNWQINRCINFATIDNDSWWVESSNITLEVEVLNYYHKYSIYSIIFVFIIKLKQILWFIFTKILAISTIAHTKSTISLNTNLRHHDIILLKKKNIVW